jgi:putative DNA primase/helicase
VRWDTDGEPKRVAGAELKTSVSHLAAAALLLRHYPNKGRRDEAAMALGGMLARGGWSAQDIEDFYGPVVRAAGDEEAAQRVKAAFGSIAHLQAGKETTGYPKVAEIWGDDIAGKVGDWLGLKRPTTKAPDGKLVIRIIAGQIAREVDEAQAALIAAGLPVFVHGGRLVEPITVERETADGSRTTTAIFAALSELKIEYVLNKYAAVFERFNARSREWVVIDPPSEIAQTLLALKRWDFPEVIGVVGAPTMRPDGSVVSEPGYDQATRLWCDADNLALPPIPEQPTRQQAVAALQLYRDLLSGFPFVHAVDRAVALAAILTVVLRGAIDLAPMFLIVAHDVGNGKSYLVDLFATIVTGRACPVVTPGRTAEEMEKRLGAILLEGGIAVSLDNLSFDLESDLLCQILTQPIVKVRILGQSAIPECEWRGTLFGTGNNIRVVGDLVRRALTCNLDAKVERPELRKFAFDPIARVHTDRGSYIAAAMTIARAYRASASAPAGYRPLAGYGAWSRVVREPLLWLGEEDPVGSMEQMRTADPERSAASQLLQHWRNGFGFNELVTVQDVIAKAEVKRDSASYLYPGFRALLLEHAGGAKSDLIDARRLGRWLQKQHGKVYDGMRIDVVQRKGSVNQYRLVGLDEGGSQ